MKKIMIAGAAVAALMLSGCSEIPEAKNKGGLDEFDDDVLERFDELPDAKSEDE